MLIKQNFRLRLDWAFHCHCSRQGREFHKTDILDWSLYILWKQLSTIFKWHGASRGLSTTAAEPKRIIIGHSSICYILYHH